MSAVTLIAAIGQRGQLGLNGDMPWGRAYPDDLKRFREITTGGVLIAGYRTLASIWGLDGTYGRDLVEDQPRRHSTDDTLHIIRRDFPNRPIFIAGGAKTYQRWMPHITDFDVTRLPFNGPADVWAAFLLSHVTRDLAA